MDNYERQVLESVLEMLHGLIGRADAAADYRPILTIFPGGALTSANLSPMNQQKKSPLHNVTEEKKKQSKHRHFEIHRKGVS